jgi:pSer/pThr/pTyr-binding forkhead associated (FHA) protein
MADVGSRNVLYINNRPVTRLEKDQYVPTAIVPNIAVSLEDDYPNETTSSSAMMWAYKPILLIANKQLGQYFDVNVEISFAIEVTFRGLR